MSSYSPFPIPTRRAVVTGRGAVTPVGLSWEESWHNLVAGRSGIKRLTDVDTSDLPVHIAGQIVGFKPDEDLPRSLIHRTDSSVQLALVAANSALGDAKLEIDAEVAPRVGVIVGTGGGPQKSVLSANAVFQQRGPRGLSPSFFASSGPDSAAGEISLHTGAQGPSHCMTTACATGATCIGEALRLIQSGRVDVVIAGGVDDSIGRLDIAAAARSTALSRRNDPPEAASRPFDRDRDGFVFSAGAGVVVLEDAHHAEQRGAPVYSEVAGYGATTDAFHLTAPQPEGSSVERAMRQAMDEAGVGPADVGYVNAHGTGTRANDTIEVNVIRRVLGEYAKQVPVSSTKSVTGHMLGGTGAVEVVAAIEAIRTGIVPPTINCDNPEDPEINFVPHHSQEHSVNVALSNSFGFGGHNVVLVARRWQG